MFPGNFLVVRIVILEGPVKEFLKKNHARHRAGQKPIKNFTLFEQLKKTSFSGFYGFYTLQIHIKPSNINPGNVPTLLTPTPSVSGTSMSSKTPGGDLEDRKSLDRLFVNQSTSNLQETFLGIVQPSWHHLQVCQEHPCPPRLQEDTWRTGGVLTPF